MRVFTFRNREKIRTTKEIKEQLLTILNFIIDKGSVTGYMLRENII